MSDAAPSYCLPEGPEKAGPSVRPFAMEALKRAGFQTADASALAHLEDKLQECESHAAASLAALC